MPHVLRRFDLWWLPYAPLAVLWLFAPWLILFGAIAGFGLDADPARRARYRWVGKASLVWTLVVAALGTSVGG